MKYRLLFAFLLLPMFAGAQTYTFSTLANFPPTSKHGPQEPTAPLIIDSVGNLYGTSWHGGTHDSCCGGDGTVFKVTPSGVLTVLHNFNAAARDGALPFANVVRDSAGNLYGTTTSGGTTGGGTVFKLSPSGVETILHNFTGEINGNEPFNAVTLDGKGHIYGYVFNFVNGDQTGNGLVFKLAKNGKYSIVYNFNTGFGANGANPVGSLILGRDGNFYGVTKDGGSNTVITAGIVFRFTPTNQLTVLHVFPYNSTTDLEFPSGKLTQDNEGNMYGGAQFGDGTGVFKITESGKESVFTTCCSGSQNMVRDSQGNLYGVLSNREVFSIYQVTPGGAVSTLYTFTPTQGNAVDGLAIDKQGNLYGVTGNGGTNGTGSVYKLTRHH